MLKKKYDVNLHFGNTQKTLLEMDKVDVYYGLNEQDKNSLLWGFIYEEQTKNELHNKNIGV